MAFSTILHQTKVGPMLVSTIRINSAALPGLETCVFHNERSMGNPVVTIVSAITTDRQARIDHALGIGHARAIEAAGLGPPETSTFIRNR